MTTTTTKTTEEKNHSFSYGDIENKNLSVSVHKDGATFISVHNVVSVKHSTNHLKSGEKVKGLTLTDEDGNYTFIRLFHKVRE